MPSIAHFEIPVDDLERAKHFYTELFGWTFVPQGEYTLIDVGGDGPMGGMMKRVMPEQTITDYMLVDSVDDAAAKAVSLGGHIVVPKMEIPDVGWFALVGDTEGNVFGVFEERRQRNG